MPPQTLKPAVYRFLVFITFVDDCVMTLGREKTFASSAGTEGENGPWDGRAFQSLGSHSLFGKAGCARQNLAHFYVDDRDGLVRVDAILHQATDQFGQAAPHITQGAGGAGFGKVLSERHRVGAGITEKISLLQEAYGSTGGIDREQASDAQPAHSGDRTVEKSFGRNRGDRGGHDLFDASVESCGTFSCEQGDDVAFGDNAVGPAPFVVAGDRRA